MAEPIVANSEPADEGPAWAPCASCGEFWCHIHDMHAHDCPCPAIEEWEVDPYTTRPKDPTA